MELDKRKVGNNYKYSCSKNSVSDDKVIRSWSNAFLYRKEDIESKTKGLRIPQFGALSAIKAFWTVEESPATIVMPTGTGKTETMIATIVSEQIKHTVIVVPSNLLRSQTVEKVSTFGVLKKIGIVDKKAWYPTTVLLKSLPKTTDELLELIENTNVIVTTISLISKFSKSQQEVITEFTDLLIVDEAHHIASPTWSAFKSNFKDRKILQFTATPFRNDGKKVDGKIIYNFPLSMAQEQGYFQKINFYPITEFNEEKGDLSIAQQAVKRLEDDIRKGYEHIILVRTTKISRANELFDNIYNKYYKKYNPVLIVSGVSAIEKRERISALYRLESRIVVCVDMFGEGIDIPNLKIAAIHDRYQSLPITLQFIGRFARTQNGLGDASVVTNIINENIKGSLKELYSQDSDWNKILADMSSKAVGKEVTLQELESGFSGNGIEGISIKQIIPKVSMQAFKITDAQPMWEGWEKVFNADRCKYYLNEDKNVLIVIEAAESNIEWSTYREITNLNWELYIVYINREKNIAFVNTSVKTAATKLIEAICGKCERIMGEQVFKCLYGINRLMLGTVGLNSAISGPVRYKMFAGVDIAQGISEAQKSSSTKSNIFGVGYDGNGKASIGCSYKGTIWSRWVESIDYWMEWCNKTIDKIMDSSINVKEILDGVLIPRIITEIPNIVPYRIDWPIELDLCNETAVYLHNGIIDEAIFNTEILLCDNTEVDNIIFCVKSENFHEEFLFTIDKEGFRIQHKEGNILSINKSKKEFLLKDFFQENPPNIKFVDQSMLEGNYYVTLKEKQSLNFSVNKIIKWEWEGVDIKKESQGLSKNVDSIQYYLIKKLKDSREYALIFDDDNSGEIADVIAIKIKTEEIVFEFYHCKFAHGDKPGGRVADLYEVCGQAEKSVNWKQNLNKVVDRMVKRENDRNKSGRPSRFELGDFSSLYEIKNRLKVFPSCLKIYIVQPGVHSNKISEGMNQILAASDNYLFETYGLDLYLICS